MRNKDSSPPARGGPLPQCLHGGHGGDELGPLPMHVRMLVWDSLATPIESVRIKLKSEDEALQRAPAALLQ